jgi:hypothetical protein
MLDERHRAEPPTRNERTVVGAAEAEAEAASR